MEERAKNNAYLGSQSFVLASYALLLCYFLNDDDKQKIADTVFSAYITYFRELTSNRPLSAIELVDFSKRVLLWNNSKYDKNYKAIECCYTPESDLKQLSMTSKELLASIMLQCMCAALKGGVAEYADIIDFHNWLLQNSNKLSISIPCPIIISIRVLTNPKVPEILSIATDLIKIPDTNKGMLLLYRTEGEMRSEFVYFDKEQRKYCLINPNDGKLRLTGELNFPVEDFMIFDTNENSAKKDRYIFQTLHTTEENYTRCCEYFLNDDKPRYLGSKEDRKCRFCGRTKEEGATFRKKAHALSNLIGNRLLFSYYECDDCNQKFSYYENDFAEYFKPYHALLGVKGKNGIPTYRQYLSHIGAVDNHIDISIFEEDPTIKYSIDERNNNFTISCRRSYIPLNVYKALTKMALTILPEKDITHFNRTLDFLYNLSAKANHPLPILIQQYGGGNNVFDFVSAFVLKRKENAEDNVPAYMFVLAYNNFCFQVPLIYCDLDNHLVGKRIIMPKVPTPPLMMGFNIIKSEELDLSSADKMKNEEVSITMHCSLLKEEEIPPQTSPEVE